MDTYKSGSPMKNFKSFLYCDVMILVYYFAMSFINLELDIFNWDVLSRFLFACCVILEINSLMKKLIK